MNVLLIGFNYRNTPVEIRECLFVNETQANALLAELVNQINSITEAVIVSTCNRVELYCVTAEVSRAEKEILRQFSRWFELDEDVLHQYRFYLQDREAVAHLMTVASGLDSMILGEPQILGQVSRAIESAHRVFASGTILNRIFLDAVHTGKRARTETSISEFTTSVSHVAALKVSESLKHIDNPYVLVFGAGEMAEICVQALTHNHIANVGIMNRTYERAVELANQYEVTAHKWHKLWDELKRADAVITATGAPHTLLHRVDIEHVMKDRCQRYLLIVDVAVPRDVESTVNEIEGATVFDIDDLQVVIDGHLAQRQACIPEVHSIIEAELDKCTTWLAGRKVVPVIRGLREKVTMVVESELQLALNRLDHLEDDDRAVVERLAHRIINKVLHEPTTNLREYATREKSDNYSQVVRDLFALDDQQIAR